MVNPSSRRWDSLWEAITTGLSSRCGNSTLGGSASILASRCRNGPSWCILPPRRRCGSRWSHMFNLPPGHGVGPWRSSDPSRGIPRSPSSNVGPILRLGGGSSTARGLLVIVYLLGRELWFGRPTTQHHPGGTQMLPGNGRVAADGGARHHPRVGGQSGR